MVRIRLTRNGPRALRRDPKVLADLLRRAQRIAAAAGPGMEAFADVGVNRARAAVVTTTSEAMRAEATGRALSRAIDAGR